MKNVSIDEVAKVVADITGGGALCMDSEDDCRDMARQFADAFQLEDAERAEFADAAGFESVADMDMPRYDETCVLCENGEPHTEH